MIDLDVLVVGSGFSGSLVAAALARRGRRVALLERGRHPRFAIGESSTPLANLLLEELADRYDLPLVRALSKWGTWQRTHPEIACGLKRGFTFFFHTPGQPFEDDHRHRRQLMVAASPHDAIADTHWYRPEFDHALVREAERLGVLYLDEVQVDRIDASDPVIVEATRQSETLRIRARFLVDATGPRGCLHRALQLPEAPLRWLPPTAGIYSHFEGVGRWDGINAATGAPPYPPDDAALHHVFPGGWIWILRFNNGLTSAGAALTSPVAARIGIDEGPAGWARLLATLPSVREQFAEARAAIPFTVSNRLAFRSGRAAGHNWALLPSAAGVIDPLLSTGFPLTLLGVTRLLEILESTSPGSERAAALREYESLTLDELELTERLVAALYATMHDPELFKRLTLLYFAAASFSEAARRLGKPALAPGFLLRGHDGFARRVRRCSELGCTVPTGDTRREVLEQIDAALEPLDIAGLGERSRADWYPVLASDLLAAASKLQATDAEIRTLLERSGFPVF